MIKIIIFLFSFFTPLVIIFGFKKHRADEISKESYRKLHILVSILSSLLSVQIFFAFYHWFIIGYKTFTYYYILTIIFITILYSYKEKEKDKGERSFSKLGIRLLLILSVIFVYMSFNGITHNVLHNDKNIRIENDYDSNTEPQILPNLYEKKILFEKRHFLDFSGDNWYDIKKEELESVSYRLENNRYYVDFNLKSGKTIKTQTY